MTSCFWKCTLVNWISEKPPTVTQSCKRKKNLFRAFPMERLTAKLKGEYNSLNDINDIWRRLVDYLTRFFAIAKLIISFPK